MARPVILITLLVVFFNSSQSDDVQTPETSLKEHVKEIDKVIAEIQAHSQAQEQKYSAVLSSVLSQLTQTTDKLEDLEASYNETIGKLEAKDAELAELWERHNETVLDLNELRKKHNNVVIEFEETRSKLEDLELQPNANGNIGFHTRVSKGKQVLANEPIILDRIVYITGASSDENTGKFLIQVNGTYLVWINFTYRQPRRPIGFIIQTENDVIDKAYGSSSAQHGTASTTSMSYLQQGEYIWVAPTHDVFLDDFYCNFGTVLLNAH